MSCYFKNQQLSTSMNQFFHQYIRRSHQQTILQFKKITKAISTLKITFFFVFLAEIFLSWYWVTYFPTSWIIAIALGIGVLTVFAYFVLLFYLQTKKPEQITEIKERFIRSCRQTVSAPKGSVEHHLLVADALFKLSMHLQGIENSYFPFTFWKQFFQKLSIYFHQEDVFKMQEELFFAAIEEHMKQIKNTPTDMELHVSLAHAYVLLSKLYMEMNKKTFPRSFVRKIKSSFSKKFSIASKRAIEEFIILKSFAPNDPWILAQLAQCYHSLGMLEEEALEYEALLEISSNDHEIMYRLGRTYFELGKNAAGLFLYEELKKEGYKKARELLFFYGATKPLEEADVFS